ncbi:MAG: single-stranded DNA-binding protein [Mycobacteriales bacterium]
MSERRIPAPPAPHRNEVLLVGRLSAPAEERALPSGDLVVTWRLVVERPPGPGARVDTVDCVARGATLRRRALRWRGGEEVEVAGALRRRFFRSAAGVASRYEIEAAALRRVSPGPAGAARSPTVASG